MGLGSNLKRAREARGWTLQQLEEASGVDLGTIHALERRDSSRSMYFATLARSLGLSLEQLERGQLPHTGSGTPPVAGEPAVAYGMSPIRAWEHPDDLPEGEYVLIPRLDVHLSAGTGKEQVQIDFVERQPQAFRADWIRAERLKPAKLACMTASGRSMEPSIFDGDSLVVDTSQREVIDGRVYAIWYEGGERVKRLYRLPGGGLRIKSDNQEFEPINLTHEEVEHVRVIGRVVLRSGKGGL